MHRADEGLLLDGALPVSLQRVDNFPEDSELAHINDKNESFLRVSLSPLEPPELDEYDEISLELRRQDLKINLLLDMVGELLAQQNKLPEATALKLTAQSLECCINLGDFKPGEKLTIALYISPPTPRALKLYGEVIENEDDGDACIAIKFFGINQSVQDWLEKFIFRNHRRIVAQAHTSN